MDSDKILVMDAGQVQEYNHPYILLQRENGTLRDLVDATGTTTAKNLENIAKEVPIVFRLSIILIIHCQIAVFLEICCCSILTSSF